MPLQSFYCVSTNINIHFTNRYLKKNLGDTVYISPFSSHLFKPTPYPPYPPSNRKQLPNFNPPSHNSQPDSTKKAYHSLTQTPPNHPSRCSSSKTQPRLTCYFSFVFLYWSQRKSGGRDGVCKCIYLGQCRGFRL